MAWALYVSMTYNILFGSLDFQITQSAKDPTGDTIQRDNREPGLQSQATTVPRDSVCRMSLRTHERFITRFAPVTAVHRRPTNQTVLAARVYPTEVRCRRRRCSAAILLPLIDGLPVDVDRHV